MEGYFKSLSVIIQAHRGYCKLCRLNELQRPLVGDHLHCSLPEITPSGSPIVNAARGSLKSIIQSFNVLNNVL